MAMSKLQGASEMAPEAQWDNLPPRHSDADGGDSGGLVGRTAGRSIGRESREITLGSVYFPS